MENLTVILIIGLALCALGRCYYNSLSEDCGDGCGCGGGCAGGCGNCGNQRDLKPVSTDAAEKNEKTRPVKSAQIPAA